MIHLRKPREKLTDKFINLCCFSQCHDDSRMNDYTIYIWSRHFEIIFWCKPFTLTSVLTFIFQNRS